MAGLPAWAPQPQSDELVPTGPPLAAAALHRHYGRPTGQGQPAVVEAHGPLMHLPQSPMDETSCNRTITMAASVCLRDNSQPGMVAVDGLPPQLSRPATTNASNANGRDQPRLACHGDTLAILVEATAASACHHGRLNHQWIKPTTTGLPSKPSRSTTVKTPSGRGKAATAAVFG